MKQPFLTWERQLIRSARISLAIILACVVTVRGQIPQSRMQPEQIGVGYDLTKKNVDSIIENHPATQKTLSAFRKLKSRSISENRNRVTPASYIPIEQESPKGFQPPQNAKPVTGTPKSNPSTSKVIEFSSPKTEARQSGSIQTPAKKGTQPNPRTQSKPRIQPNPRSKTSEPFNQLPLLDIQAEQKSFHTQSAQSPPELPPVEQSQTPPNSISQKVDAPLVEPIDENVPRIQRPVPQVKLNDNDFRARSQTGSQSTQNADTTDFDSRWSNANSAPAPKRIRRDDSRPSDLSIPNRLSAATESTTSLETTNQYSQLFSDHSKNTTSKVHPGKFVEEGTQVTSEAQQSQSGLSATEIESILKDAQSQIQPLRQASANNPYVRSDNSHGHFESSPTETHYQPRQPVTRDNARRSVVNNTNHLRSLRGNELKRNDVQNTQDSFQEPFRSQPNLPANQTVTPNQISPEAVDQKAKTAPAKKYILRKNDPENDNGQKQQGVSATIKRVAITTCFVLILCVGTILTLKKLGVRGAATKPDETQSMTVVDRTSINNKCELQLVQIKNQKVLIGVDQNGIKSMTYIPNSFTDEFDSAVDTPRKI